MGKVRVWKNDVKGLYHRHVEEVNMFLRLITGHMFGGVGLAFGTEMWRFVGIKLGLVKFGVFGGVGSIVRRLNAVPGTWTWLVGPFGQGSGMEVEEGGSGNEGGFDEARGKQCAVALEVHA